MKPIITTLGFQIDCACRLSVCFMKKYKAIREDIRIIKNKVGDNI